MTIGLPTGSSHTVSRIQRNSWTAIRSDAAIEEEICQSFQKTANLGAICQENIGLEAQSGFVYLWGHVKNRGDRYDAECIAREVKGVTGIKNEIIIDDDLRSQVVQALLQDERTCPYVIRVNCRFGWVSLTGLVPSLEAGLAVQEVAASVPVVRGIVGLPSIFELMLKTGANPEPLRRTFQPRLGTPVYRETNEDKADTLGLVSQVILHPCSRLVSHIAVRPTIQKAENRLLSDRVLPIETVEAVSERGVWLSPDQGGIDRYPDFDPRQFPLPPQAWRPPFPYPPGTVRWSL